jgi:hypothetical protein
MASPGRLPGVSRQLRISVTAEPNSSELRVAVAASSGEREEQEFRHRVTQAQLDAALAGTGDANKPSLQRSTVVESVDPAQDVGGRLFDAVFGGRLGGIWVQEALAAQDDGAPMQVRLATDVADVGKLPWELLYDVLVRNDFVVLCRDWSLVRDRPTGPTPARKRKAARKSLRVLVAAANVPTSPMPGIEQEIAVLEDLAGAGGLTLEVLRDPSSLELLNALGNGDYEIFHFMGTGAENGSGLSLAIAGRQPPLDTLDSDRLIAALSAQPRLQLVFLNGCVTDQVARDAAGVVPSSIGMQGLPLDAAAVSFSRSVYGALIKGTSLSTAVATGRKALDREFPGSRQWAMPVVYTPADETPLLLPARPRAGKAAPRAGSLGKELPDAPHEQKIAIQLEIANRNLEALREQLKPNGPAPPAFVAAEMERAEAQVEALTTELQPGDEDEHRR